jgi:hypothetical protein
MAPSPEAPLSIPSLPDELGPFFRTSGSIRNHGGLEFIVLPWPGGGAQFAPQLFAYSLASVVTKLVPLTAHWPLLHQQTPERQKGPVVRGHGVLDARFVVQRLPGSQRNPIRIAMLKTARRQ